MTYPKELNMSGSNAVMQEVPRTIPSEVRTEVEMTLTDGTVLTGEMLMLTNQFVLDVINDDRRFVPFAASDGPVKAINKEVIACITEIERQVQKDEKVVAYM
jgi:hypothetical protein